MLYRDLTVEEQRAVELVRHLETLSSFERNTTEIILREGALTGLVAQNILKPLQSTPINNTDTLLVRISLQDYGKYIDFICEMLGMSVAADGSITTFDNQVLAT